MRRRARRCVELGCVAALTGLLGFAAWRKIVGPELSGASSDRMLLWVDERLPGALRAVGKGSAWLELGIAGLLLWRRTRDVGLQLAIGLAAVWAVVVLHLQGLGVSPAACGCFGSGAQVSYGVHYGIIGGTFVFGIAGLRIAGTGQR